MALILRETKGSPLSFGEMDGNLTYLEGKGFPYTGDAVIDGTLNIDFTDAIDFYSGSDLEVPSGINDLLKGDMMGYLLQEGDDSIFSGLVDGVNEVFGGFAEIEVKIHTTGFVDTGTNDVVSSTIGKLDIPEDLGGGSIITNIPLRAIFAEEDEDEYATYVLRAQKSSSGRNSFDLRKEYTDGEKTEAVEMYLSNDEPGFVFTNDLDDDTASVYLFENNEEESILDLRNDNIVSEILAEKNFADDAAAEAGDVPLNGLYHTNGAVKIRLI